jgi:hypothetical protein
MKQVFIHLSLIALGLFAAAPAAMAQTSMTYKDSNPNSYSLSLGNYYSFPLGYTHTYLGMNMRPNVVNGGWTLGTDGGNNGGSMITGNVGGSLNFIAIPTANGASVQNLTDAQAASYSRMRINSNGVVDIPGQLHLGQLSPLSPHTDYRLAVDGKLLAKSIYVTDASKWADFVFEPSYKLMALPTLESYLQKNKHLPYIPSAKEVEANGYNVAEMDAKLLRTVEELTLQVIELAKQNKQLHSELVNLRVRVAKKSGK